MSTVILPKIAFQPCCQTIENLAVYNVISYGLQDFQTFLIIFIFYQNVIRIVSRHRKIEMLLFAKTVAILDNIPINEKSKAP